MEMMKKSITVGAVMAILLAAAAYLWIGSSTPPGQDPLSTLTPANLADFAGAFDKSVEGPRLVLLLSPT
jgi:hypothetical protein